MKIDIDRAWDFARVHELEDGFAGFVIVSGDGCAGLHRLAGQALDEFAVEDSAGWGLETPLTGYEQWSTTNFTPSEIVPGWHSPLLIAADDEMPNLLRYALGQPAFGPPSVPGNLPEVGIDGAGHLTLGFYRASIDVNYIVEVSNDLVTWTPAATNPGTAGSLVQFVDESALQGQTRRFARLRVSQ